MASSLLIQSVQELVSRPESAIKMKDLRKLVKEHPNELLSIKLSGKGRTKQSILDDLKLWLREEQYVQPLQQSPKIETQTRMQHTGIEEEIKSNSESLMLSPINP